MGASKRFIVLGDNHGDRADNGAVRVAREFCKSFKPEIRIHAGDCIDARFLRKGATAEETRDGMQDDLDAGLALLDWFKPTKFLRGNHDERIWDAAKSDDKPKSEFASRVVTDIIEVLPKGCIVLPYHKRLGVAKLGKWSVIHSFQSGVNAVRNAAQVYGNVLLWHIHAADQQSVPGIERKIGRSFGCLCQLDQDYNRAHTNTLRQSHGFAYGWLHDDGEATILHAEAIGGRWLLPTEFREFKGADK